MQDNETDIPGESFTSGFPERCLKLSGQSDTQQIEELQTLLRLAKNVDKTKVRKINWENSIVDFSLAASKKIRNFIGYKLRSLKRSLKLTQTKLSTPANDDKFAQNVNLDQNRIINVNISSLSTQLSCLQTKYDKLAEDNQILKSSMETSLIQKVETEQELHVLKMQPEFKRISLKNLQKSKVLSTTIGSRKRKCLGNLVENWPDSSTSVLPLHCDRACQTEFLPLFTGFNDDSLDFQGNSKLHEKKITQLTTVPRMSARSSLESIIDKDIICISVPIIRKRMFKVILSGCSKLEIRTPRKIFFSPKKTVFIPFGGSVS